MFRKLSRIYGILSSLLIINHGLGLSHTGQIAKKVFGYGWPPLFVNVSMETVPIKGIVKYNLLYNRTCPDSCYRHPVDKELCEANLSPVDGCFFVENQTSIHPKYFNCVICDSSEHCKSMGITEDHNLCLCLKVTTMASSSYTCMERSYNDIFVHPPPTSIQVLATERKALTVRWDPPSEIAPNLLMKCKLLLHDQLGNCTKKLRYLVEENVNTFTFSALTPWTNYSVTICCGCYAYKIQLACTCDGSSSPWYIPGGPVLQHTLPEEPTEAPLLHPCRASCSGKYLNGTLTWQTRDGMMWNGIPIKSEIMIWNMSAADNQTNLGDPDITLSVPLPAAYNGSLVTYTIHNLRKDSRYELKFCSNGGCGPAEDGFFSCDKCIATTRKGTPSPKLPEPKTSLLYVIVVVVVTVVIFTCFGAWVCHRTKRRRNFLTPLRNVIGDVGLPENYDELDFSNSAADSGPYSQIVISDRQGLLSANQMPEFV